MDQRDFEWMVKKLRESLPPELLRQMNEVIGEAELHQAEQKLAESGAFIGLYDAEVQTQLESSASPDEDVTEEDEELVKRCLEIIRQEKKASTSMLQRRLRLGYTRAARVVDILERRGILGPGEGAKPREILVPLDALVSESGMDSGQLFGG